MILFGDKTLVETNFENEQEIEILVIANSEYFFGPSSIFISKKLIKTEDGYGTVPDGFAIDLASRTWYIVEAELSHHNVWSHIAPQVAKQLLAVRREETRRLIIDKTVEMIRDDVAIKEKFHDEKIREIDIRKVLQEILETPPVIGMPIDAVTNDLKEWAKTFKNEVKLWIVKKLINLGKSGEIAYEIPEELRPAFDTSNNGNEPKSGIRTYDVSISDLIGEGILSNNQELLMNYKQRGGKQRSFTATVEKDGALKVMGEAFPSPSYAAVFCIQKAGSNRKTVNGWTSWKTKNGKYLAQLRAEYLEKKEIEANQEANIN